ncbi:MAG TPA: ABC transporter permease [Terriglobia bacterium]|jgi:phospholipid/cholesterol/gamma-HCH transport system permease protein|nr:ABC transporter permease [Terriglobia bacterium]
MTAVLALIGRSTLGLARYSQGLYRLTRDTAYWTFVAPFKGRGFKGQAAIHQMVMAGVNSIPIVGTISVFVGIILALQGAYAMRNIGAGPYYIALLVGVAMTRELGPLITAIIVAGRSGSAFAAEIGTMKVSEEIDALEAMGLNSIKYLVVPKYLALLVMMPCLTILSDAAGILGGGIFQMYQLDQTFLMFLAATRDTLVMRDIWTGLIKSLVFGLIIAKVGCYEGFAVRGGAEGVGKATTSSVVISIFLVIAADVVFTALFYYTS